MSFLNFRKKEKKKNRLVFSPGNYTWTVPDNVIEVEVHVWGGGGNGRSCSSTNPALVGSGGGGGGYVRHLYRVTGGNILQIAVGGQGGTSSVSCPSNPVPQPISATGGSDGAQQPGNSVSLVVGGAGGVGSLTGVPIPLRVNGITMTAAGGAGGGVVDTTTQYAPTAGLPFNTPFGSVPRFLQPTTSPFGPQVLGDFIGASGGAAGSHLGNGGLGTPSIGYPTSRPILPTRSDGISLANFPTITWGPYGVLWSAGGAGIGGQSISPFMIKDLGLNPFTAGFAPEPSDKTYFSHSFRGASAEYPDFCPVAVMGTRNKADYNTSKVETSDLATSVPLYFGPVGSTNEKYGVINEKWFYVEEIVGSNGCEVFSNSATPYRRAEPTFRAGCGQNGYIETINIQSAPLPPAPFLGGGCGGKYLDTSYMSVFPVFSPLFGTDWQGRGGSGSIGGGGGGQALAQPGDNGVGGTGCVIIYW
jgi:hypothetical protein